MNQFMKLSSVFALLFSYALCAQDATVEVKQEVAEVAQATSVAVKKTAEEQKKVADQAAKKVEEIKKNEAEKKAAQDKEAAQKVDIAQEELKKNQEEKKAEDKTSAAQKESAEKEEAAIKAEKAAQESAKKMEEDKKKQAEKKIAQEKAKAEQDTIEQKAMKDKAAKQLAQSEGIDTLELEGGNWLLKRQALEKTVDIIEQINGYFTKVLEARIDFLVKRNKVDRDFDAFINKIGFEIGDLSRLLNNLMQELEDERKALGDLSEEERSALTELDVKIKQIKQLQEEVLKATDLANSLDDVIMQVEQEVTIANTYQANAWKNFQAIKKVLNDERAEELYLETQGLLKNIQAVDVYLKEKLQDYFNGIIRTTKQETSKIESALQALTDKGINFKEEIGRFLDNDKKRIEDKKIKINEEEKSEEALKKAKAATQKKVIKKVGWLDWLASLWDYPVSLFDSIWKYTASFFGGKSEVQVAQRKNIAKIEDATPSSKPVVVN